MVKELTYPLRAGIEICVKACALRPAKSRWTWLCWTLIGLGSVAQAEPPSNPLIPASSQQNPSLRLGVTTWEADGVTMPREVITGQTVTLAVTVINRTQNNAYLNAWIDFNADGILNPDLVDAGGEKLESQLVIPSANGPQTHWITFQVPYGVPSNILRGARLRLTSISNPNPVGAAASGEVEDYVLAVLEGCPPALNRPTLEMAAGAGNPTGLGPTLAPQVIALQENADNPTGQSFGSADPALTVTYAFQNQQFLVPTNIMPTGTGMSFGSASGANAGTAGRSLFPLIGGISAPTDPHFTAAPFGQPSTGISVQDNRATAIFTSANTLRHVGLPTDGRHYYGDLRVTFSSPVTDPVMHIVGIGAQASSSGQTQGMSAELELATPGIVLTRMSGSDELVIEDGTKILNRSAVPRAATGAGAASGSMLVGGQDLTELVFRVFMRGDGKGVEWSGGTSDAGDLWLVGFSQATPLRDFGDLSGLDFASSRVSRLLRLGTRLDADFEPRSDITATADDLDCLDDEDGVLLPPALNPGTNASLTINATNLAAIPAYVSVWIDWNSDGRFDGPSELVRRDLLISAGREAEDHVISFQVPTQAVTGFAAVRVRLTDTANAAPEGAAGFGEVEDTRVWVGPELTFCPPMSTLPAAVQNQPYQLDLTVSGGSGPYLYQLTSGNLPAGLALSGASGVLSGTPTVAGSFSFTLRVTDSQGTQTSHPYTLLVRPAGGLLLVSSGTNDVSILGTRLLRNQTTELVQTQSASGVTLLTDEPVEILELTIRDEGVVKTLGVVNKGGGEVRNVTISPDNTGFSIIDNGTVRTMAQLGLTQFSALAAATSSNSNLNNYVDDNRGDSLPDGNPEYDMMFAFPYGLNDYIIMSERFGNSTARLIPLDADGNVIPGSNAVQVGPTYGWNSGVASSRQTTQPYWFTVIKVSTFGVTQPIHGLRYDTHGADVKFFGMGESEFSASQGTPASVGDFVWHDLNGNGIQDSGEPGIPNTSVRLLRAGGSGIVAETVTNSAGFYTFPNVGPGDYQLEFDLAPGMRFTDFRVGSDSARDSDVSPLTGRTPVFTMLPCDVRNDLDVGLLLENCAPILVVAEGDGMAVEGLPFQWKLNATGGNGPYLFRVVSGALPSWARLDAASGVISGVPDGTNGAVFTIEARDIWGCSGAAEMVLSVQPAPSLGVGNLVFFDVNDNGRADPGEGVANVPVHLYTVAQTPGVDTPLATTVTTGTGAYLFDGLPFGQYVVHVAASAFQPGGPLEGTSPIAEGLSGDDDVGQNGQNIGIPEIDGVSSDIAVLALGMAPTDESGETGFDAASDNEFDAAIDLTIDFGFQRPVGIGNLVFVDADGNGRADLGEGAAGVQVELYRADQEPGLSLPILVQTTDANGVYFFDRMVPGDYWVHIPASEFGFGRPLWRLVSMSDSSVGDDDTGEDGTDDPLPEVNGISSALVELRRGLMPTNESGESGLFNTIDDRSDANFDLTIDFGFSPPDPDEVGVGNVVFTDQNGNGRYDVGEGVDDVLVQLFRATDDPQTAVPLASMRTFDEGTYFFRGLTEGHYRVHVPASEFQPGAPLHGLVSMPGAGGDWGFDDDLDENGVNASEPWVTGISSIEFHLEPGTEPTNLWGEYGKSPEIDDVNDANFDLTIDLGFTVPMGIGNLVFNDLNGNGRADSGEGVAAVPVHLFRWGDDPSWSTPLAETITDTEGRYLFSELGPGLYFVYLPPSAFASGATLHGLVSLPGVFYGDDDTGESGEDSQNAAAEGLRSVLIELLPGNCPVGEAESGFEGDSDDANDSNIDLTIDFGFSTAGSIGDLVFFDVDGDGIWTPNGANGLPGTEDDELSLSGVELTLWSLGPDGLTGGGDDVQIGNAVLTDLEGRYRFTGLASGKYYVLVSPENFNGGVLNGFPLSSPLVHELGVGEDGYNRGRQINGSGSMAYSPVVTLAPGQDELRMDFGFLAAPPPPTWSAWRAQYAYLTDTTPTGNSDGDLYTNLEEFALGLNPLSGLAVRSPVRVEVEPMSQRIDVCVDRRTDVAGVTLTLQVLANLAASPGGWMDVTTLTPTVTHRSDGTEELRYMDVGALPALTAGTGFARVKIDLDTDMNGVPEATVFSKVVGWSRRQLEVQLQTVAHSFASAERFTAMVDSIQGNSLTVSSALNGENLTTIFTSDAQYYVEVRTGIHAGHRFDIDESNSVASSLLIDSSSAQNTLEHLPTSLAGAQMVLREHLTLGRLASRTRFRATTNVNTADRVLLYDNASSSFRVYWLLAFGNQPRWVLQGDNQFTDRENLVISPGLGVFIHKRNAPIQITLSGEVRDYAFACPLTTGVSLCSAGWPMDLSPHALDMNGENGFTGASNESRSDQLTCWRGDTEPATEGYTTHYLLHAGQIRQWVRVGDSRFDSFNNVQLIRSGGAFFMRSRNANPTWVQPLPWIPSAPE